MKERLLMTSASTTRDEVPTPGSADETFLDRIGIPHVLRWGFLGVLIFMTGNAVETNFVSPHMANVFGGGDEKINLAATIITLYSLASLRSEEHTSELQSRGHLVCRLLLEKKKINIE